MELVQLTPHRLQLGVDLVHAVPPHDDIEGRFAVDPSNEAYKFGINYLMYGMTR